MNDLNKYPYIKTNYQNVWDRLACEYILKIDHTDIIDWFDYLVIRYLESMMKEGRNLRFTMDISTQNITKDKIKNIILNNPNLAPDDDELIMLIMDACSVLYNAKNKELKERIEKLKIYAGVQLVILNTKTRETQGV